MRTKEEKVIKAIKTGKYEEIMNYRLKDIEAMGFQVLIANPANK